jgi:hypothetical protein
VFENHLVNFTSPQSSASLSLENNRLSGMLPGSVLHMENISVLEGNLFACKIDKSDLPKADDARNAYQCASNSFDVPYYIWLSLTFVCVFLATAMYYFREKMDRYIAFTQTLNDCTLWFQALDLYNNNFPDEVNSKIRNLCYILTLCEALCKVAGCCFVFILVVFLPLYCGISVAYGTHVHQYTYTVSASFSSGTVPFALQFTGCALLLLVAACCFNYLTRSFDDIHRNNLKEISIFNTTITKVAHFSTAPVVQKTTKVQRLMVCGAFFVISFTVVLGVNIVFVIVALYQSTTLLTIFQVHWTQSVVS